MTKHEKERYRLLFVSTFAIVAILTLAYLLEVLKGERTWLYYGVFLAILWLPFILCLVLKHKRDWHQYILVMGFSLAYLFVSLTTDSKLAYVYQFVIVGGLIAICKIRLTLVYSIFCTLCNVASLCITLSKDTSPDTVADCEIQIFSTLLVMGLTTWGCYLMKTQMEQKVNEITDAMKNQQSLLDQLKASVASVNVSLGSIKSGAENIEKASNNTQESIGNLADGATEAAETVQTQLSLSIEIENSIQELLEVSKLLSQSIKVVNDTSESGVSVVTDIETVNSSLVTVNEELGVAVEKLKENASSALGVINIIEGISKQTNLLGLNASIEAARAGEFGRGFAVVAGEISNMAVETNTATQDVSKIIMEIVDSIQEIYTTIFNMIAKSSEQSKLINEAVEKFNSIHESVSNAKDVVLKQEKNVEAISEADKRIADMIEGLSSFTEELTATAEVTKDQSQTNLRNVEHIVEDLNVVISELNKLKTLTH